MKFKMTSDAAGRVLSLECDKDDEFAYVDAERVQRGDLDSFLPFACWKGKKAYELAYRVGGYPSLQQVLSAPLGSGYLRAIMGSILNLMHECEGNNLSRNRVVFDAEHVFFDIEAGSLRFVYVPMRSFVSPAGEASLLAQVCRAAKVGGEDGPFVAAIWDYACRTAILTSVGFERFLREWGMKADGLHVRKIRPTASGSAFDSRESHGWNFVEDLRAQEIVQDDGSCGAIVLEHVLQGVAYRFGDGEFVVGRAPDCSLSLSGCPSVSRRHAKIVVHDGTCSVEDLGSTNGVSVNGASLGAYGKATIREGDTVTFGEEKFRVTA